MKPWAGLTPEKHLEAAKEVLDKGIVSALEFDKIQPLIEQRRKLAESENKRTAALANSMSPEEARLFVIALGDSIVRHVSDPTITAAIFEDFERILGR